MSHQIKQRRRDPKVLDDDDPGYPTSDYTMKLRAQDDAFSAAMRKSPDWKRQLKPEGVRPTPAEDARVIKPMRTVTYMPSMSSLSIV